MKATPLSQTSSIDELGELFDTHDMGESWDQMPEASFEIDIRRRKHVVTLDEDLAGEADSRSRARR